MAFDLPVLYFHIMLEMHVSLKASVQVQVPGGLG